MVDVEAMENIGGTKAIMVPIDSTSALVVESRRKIGVDHRLKKEGALVYLIDTSWGTGSGPIQVKPGVDKGDEFMQDAPMQEGDTYTYQNISVKVLKARAKGDKIQVTVQ